MLQIRSISASALLLALLVGCSNGDKTNPAANNNHSDNAAQSAPANPAPAARVAPASSKTEAPSAAKPANKLPDPLIGKVKETMSGGAYTYVLMTGEYGETWAAARAFTVAVGDEVEMAGLMPMFNFKSQSLNRTFEEIQFVGTATVIGGTTATAHAQPTAQGLPPGHMPIGDPATKPVPAKSLNIEKGDVEVLSDGITVATLFEKKDELKGKVVRFRGKVVKANRGILGSNWVHIQDGSGSSGTNDITVTSKEGYAPVGSLVVIEGTLNLDRDFGAGYAYAVIVEDAKITLDTPKKDAP